MRLLLLACFALILLLPAVGCLLAGGSLAVLGLLALALWGYLLLLVRAEYQSRRRASLWGEEDENP